jgi:hypothetical protein
MSTMQKYFPLIPYHFILLMKLRMDEVTGMKQGISVPHGEELIRIELTVKEAIALTGVRFNENPKLLSEARKKVRKSLNSKVLER